MNGATLNDIRVTKARATIPAWGCWYADASLDGEHVLAGAVTLKIADLTLLGTVLSGGPQLGRSTYRIVGGKGGWGRPLPKKAYANDAGVKVATIVGDAAREAGETMGPILTSDRVGPAYTRQSTDENGNPVPASRVLHYVAPRAWYVDEAGVTQLGARAVKSLAGAVPRVGPLDKAGGKVVLAPEQIATILPGLVVDGITAVDVQHEISATGGLRSTVWGSQQSGPAEGLRTLLDHIDPYRVFRGVVEYRVVTTSGNRLNLQPVRVANGMPELERVPVRPGIAGASAEVALGTRVLVGFVDSDPARPYVASFEDADGEGFLPTSITFANGVLGAARMTDPIQAGPFAGTIVGASTKVRIG